MKCNDCGSPLTKENYTEQTARNICDSCWNTRGELVKGLIVPLGGPLFKAIQRKMGGRRGTAKRFIDSLRSVA